MASPSLANPALAAITSTGAGAAATDDPAGQFHPRRRLDKWMLAGMVIAVAATLAGIAFTKINLIYFFQPTGALIVLGGTFGVTLITTPRLALLHSARRIRELFHAEPAGREALLTELLAFNRTARRGGILAIEPLIGGASNSFLREMLTLALDSKDRAQLQSALELKVRLRERQGEADARVLEIAGGFAPTIGVLGTVVGLIDVLHRFSDPSAVALGVGTAFVSTIYGLGLANLVLLPAGCRIRASVAERFETEEMMLEGGLAVWDGLHPALLRERLHGYLRKGEDA